MKCKHCTQEAEPGRTLCSPCFKKNRKRCKVYYDQNTEKVRAAKLALHHKYYHVRQDYLKSIAPEELLREMGYYDN